MKILRITSEILFIICLCNGYRLNKSPLISSSNFPYRNANGFKPILNIKPPTPLLIMNDINEAFNSINMNHSNQLIKSMFNVTNSNPNYIFQLPANDAKKIIIKRSDFEKPKFPNLTNNYIELAHMSTRRQKFFKNSNDLQQHLTSDQIRQEYEKESMWLSDFHNEAEIFDNIEDNNELTKAVMANVVTEVNFLNYVKKMNAKGKKYLNNQKNTDFTTFIPPSSVYKFDHKSLQKRVGMARIKLVEMPFKNNDDWESMGLPGWEGELRRPKYAKEINNHHDLPAQKEIYYIDSKKNPNDIYEIQIPGQFDFFDNNEKNTIWDLPGKVSSSPAANHQLTKTYNDEDFKNISKLLTKGIKPEWPITNRRDAHKDNDIYIARANDPFGYSTKWQLKNLTGDNNTKDDRRKRGVTELYSMVKCSTGCDPLVYKGYGCFCGFMGSGIPVDSIDRCCKIHDKCYEHSNCPSYLEYFVPYLWKCYRGKPLCAIDHGEWGGPGSCADRLCQCDLRFSQCIRKFYCPRRRAVCRTSAIRMLQNYLMIV